VADVFETVVDLFEREQWAPCAEQAALALAQREWAKERKAFLLFARSSSLRRLQFYAEALEVARLAAYLAEEVEDYDLLGRSLANLAWIQYRTPGMESAAVETQRRFLALFPQYRTIRDQWLPAQLNLGTYLRAAGLHLEALAQFKATYEAAVRRGDRQVAQLSRTYAVWEALRLEKVDEAEPLIRAGEGDCEHDPRLKAGHLLDLAQLSLLKQDPAVAAGYAIAAMPFIEKALPQAPHLLPNGLEILARAGERCSDPELALVAAMLAREKAEACDRHDLVAAATDLARAIALQHPDVVVKVMESIDGVKR
jgi:tetratricopeptide (TPR) repeat protein